MVTVVMPCYRRPDVAARGAEAWLSVSCVDRVVVLLQPRDQQVPGGHMDRVEWFVVDQLFPTKARNMAVRMAWGAHRPRMVLLTDDDVLPNSHTHIGCLEGLACRWDTGLVALTRQMHDGHVESDEDLIEVCPYIGGGWLFETEKFLSVGGMPEDEMGDEKALGLAFYLSGYVNYRTRRSLAVHEQGCAGDGGLRALCRELKSGGSVDAPRRDTAFDSKHKYLRTEPAELRYGNVGFNFKTTGSAYWVTDEARRVHERNHQKLSMGRSRTTG